MPITDRNLLPGMTLVATYKREHFTCSVEAGEGGKLVFRLSDGQGFKTPSGAGHAVTKKSCNGYDFWTVEGAQVLDGVAATKAGAKTRTDRKAKLIRQVRKVPNQKGVPEGQARWFCSACMGGFFTDAGTVPEACPKGHAREVEDELAPVD